MVMPNIPCNRPLPHSPGVYQFKDGSGKIIYIGKAKDLKKRVTSYFKTPEHRQTPKTTALVRHIASVDFILADSESEAILLESNLIKQYYPKYNVDLKDSAPLAYALFTKEPYPRLLKVRKDRHGKVRGPPGKTYGPFMAGAGGVIRLIRNTFGLRPCNLPVGKRLCLQYHLGNCSGACGGKISREDYAKDVHSAEQIIAHPERMEEYLESLEKKMKDEAAADNFEKAMRLRDAVRSLRGIANRSKMDSATDKDEDYIVLWSDGDSARAQVWSMKHGVIRDRLKYEFEHVEADPLEAFLERFYESHEIPRRVIVNRLPQEAALLEQHFARLRSGAFSIERPPSRGARADLMRLIEKNMLSEKSAGADPGLALLQKELGLDRIPLVIECFDISNLAGKQIVASMVQLVNARPKKSEYRKFRMRTVVGQDDFASIKEAVFRRYRRLRDEGTPLPDLVLIDGGLGQLHAAKDALEQLDLELPLYSLAKENEEVYGLEMLHPLRLPKNSEALHVLQRARDEAHRFVIGYHRKLRKKETTG